MDNPLIVWYPRASKATDRYMPVQNMIAKSKKRKPKKKKAPPPPRLQLANVQVQVKQDEMEVQVKQDEMEVQVKQDEMEVQVKQEVKNEPKEELKYVIDSIVDSRTTRHGVMKYRCYFRKFPRCDDLWYTEKALRKDMTEKTFQCMLWRFEHHGCETPEALATDDEGN
jgi:hypothetical protein